MPNDTAELQRRIDEADEDTITLGVAKSVLGVIRSGSKTEGPNGETNPDFAVEGVLMALAAILEQALSFLAKK